jgi:hypothetical protein
MNQLLEMIEVNSNNGLYRIYQHADGNPLLKLSIFQVINGIEVPVKNMYGELKRLNNELSLNIDFEPKNRIKLNTREFGNEFIKRFKQTIVK